MTRVRRPPGALLIDVLEEHLDELDYLLRQWRAALRSPRYTLGQLYELERRIDAHADGLTIGGESTQTLAVERLATDDPGSLMAAAFALLRLEAPSAPVAVLNALRSSEGPRTQALGEALCLAPRAALAEGLQEALQSAAAPVAAASAEALAHAGRLDARAPRLSALLVDGSPEARAAGWRAVALADPRAPPDAARSYEQAIADNAAHVREAALTAAAWTRQPRLVDHCRAAADAAAPQHRAALGLLAVLGEPRDLERLLAVARNPELGPERFAWLASFGHAGVGDALRAGMALPDAKAAAAAMAAFTRMTGVDFASGKRVAVPLDGDGADGASPSDPDLFDDVPAPDLEKATRFWAEAGGRYRAGVRWAGGRDIGGPAGLKIATTLDLQTRWEAHLRARYAGAWSGNVVDLERLTLG